MRFFWAFIFISIVFSSCHKDEKITVNGKLEFSRDTIFFDTLFTSIGSVSKRLKVYNRNSQAVKISSVHLGGYSSSPYELIINGTASNSVNDIFLRGGDSMYVIVKATIDPQNNATPYLVSDSIVFNTNGNEQKVQLVAYGQDATFVTSKTLGCDTVWTAGKPFVVFNYARVPAGCTLTIKKGVRVFFHDKAVLDVKGTLLVEGEKDFVVQFAGDRLSGFYKDVAGQWQGIVFDAGSKNNKIEYAEIRNAVNGIVIKNDPLDSDTIAEVRIQNSVIQNMQLYGLISYGMDTYAENCLFTNAVRNVFAGEGGGTHYLYHCTFSNYSFKFFREGAAVRFSNQFSDLSGSASGNLKARMFNCINWGDRSEELDLNSSGSFSFDFLSYSSILKTSRTDQGVNSNLINTDPQFMKPVDMDFKLKAGSPAINSGQTTSIVIDLPGETRDVMPDRGAYEFF